MTRKGKRTDLFAGIDLWDILFELSEVSQWEYHRDPRTGEVYVQDVWNGRRYPGTKMEQVN
jgi:hypothetical protein